MKQSTIQIHNTMYDLHYSTYSKSMKNLDILPIIQIRRLINIQHVIPNIFSFDFINTIVP